MKNSNISLRFWLVTILAIFVSLGIAIFYNTKYTLELIEPLNKNSRISYSTTQGHVFNLEKATIACMKDRTEARLEEIIKYQQAIESSWLPYTTNNQEDSKKNTNNNPFIENEINKIKDIIEKIDLNNINHFIEILDYIRIIRIAIAQTQNKYNETLISTTYTRTSQLLNNTNIAFVIAISIAIFLILWINYHVNLYLSSNIRKMARFIDRITMGEVNLKFSMLEDESFHILSDSCNRLTDLLERTISESKSKIEYESSMSRILIESCKEPTLAISSNHEILLANTAARLLLAKDATDTIVALRNALIEKKEVFDADGITYKITHRPVSILAKFNGEVIQIGISQTPELKSEALEVDNYSENQEV